MKVIDGKAVAKRMREELAPRVARLVERGVTPRLAVVVVGDDPASASYARLKRRAAEKLGVRVETVELPADTPQSALCERLRALDEDDDVHAVMLEAPLPRGVDEGTAREAYSPHKDPDGLHRTNLGRLLAGRSYFEPATASAVVTLVRETGVPLVGARAVVVGRSVVVGKPAALMLLRENATVTLCHSRTRDLAAVARTADVLVVAVGVPRLAGADFVKPGAVVVDVGISYDDEGNGPFGDVDAEAVGSVAGWLTPVPGGVGPVTVATLLTNVVRAAELAAERAA